MDKIAGACDEHGDADPGGCESCVVSLAADAAVIFPPLAKNEDNNVCLPENSSQRRAASRGGSARPPSMGITCWRDSFSPVEVVISSWRSMNMGQWSEPLSEGWISPCLIHGRMPFVTRM